jgi:hypothetical protein
MPTVDPACGWQIIMKNDEILVFRNSDLVERSSLSEGLESFLIKIAQLLAKYDLSFNPKGGWMRIANAN